MYMREGTNKNGQRFITLEGMRGKYVIVVGDKSVIVGTIKGHDIPCPCGCGLPEWVPMLDQVYKYSDKLNVDFDGMVMNVIDTFARRCSDPIAHTDIVQFVERMRTDPARQKFKMADSSIKDMPAAQAHHGNDDGMPTKEWYAANGFEKKDYSIGKLYDHKESLMVVAVADGVLCIMDYKVGGDVVQFPCKPTIKNIEALMSLMEGATAR